MEIEWLWYACVVICLLYIATRYLVAIFPRKETKASSYTNLYDWDAMTDVTATGGALYADQISVAQIDASTITAMLIDWGSVPMSGSAMACAGQHIDPYTGMVVTTWVDEPPKPVSWRDDDKTRCRYCGSRHDKGLDKCPYCGGGEL